MSDWLDTLLARSIVKGGGPCPRCQRSGGSQRILYTDPRAEPNFDTCPLCGQRPHVKVRIPSNGRKIRK